jgi:SAM-dependent methyltransferase
MTSPAAFDRLARDYDDLWTNSNAGRAQRESVWHVMDRLFQPGNRILDIGCGTGEDALHLGRNGIHVSAIDASGEMVKVASSRGVASTRLAIEDLHRIHARYDGVLSNFGALNCVPNLGSVAALLGGLVRHRQYVVICLLNRACAWEMVWFGLRLRFREAFRRFHGGGVPTSLGLLVYYPSAKDVCRAFEPAFELVRSIGVGVFVPPSYVNLPDRAVRALERIDATLGGLPWLRALGDHRLYVFRQRSAC